MSIRYFPAVKPSAIALGTVFTQASHMLVLSPLFGERYGDFQRSSSTSQFLHSREARDSSILFGSVLVGSGLQTYAIASILNASAAVSYKGAAAIGTLIWATNGVGTLLGGFLGVGADTQRKQKDALEVVAGALFGIVDTVGLSLFLTWWGARTLDF